MSVYRVVISNDNTDEVLEEYITSETLPDMRQLIENNLSVYDTREDHDLADDEELEIEKEYCSECEEEIDDCVCDEETEEELGSGEN